MSKPKGKQLDVNSLIYNSCETSFVEFVRSGNQVTNIITWTDSGMTLKIREESFTYSGNMVTEVVTEQYDDSGSVIQTKTETYNRTGNIIDDIDVVIT